MKTIDYILKHGQYCWTCRAVTLRREGYCRPCLDLGRARNPRADIIEKRLREYFEDMESKEIEGHIIINFQDLSTFLAKEDKL